MGVLSSKEENVKYLILVGGFHLPFPGPIKSQVSDSNLFILKYPDMVWKKLPTSESLNRNFPGIHVVGNIVYVIGGWRYEDNIATELFPLTEITRIILNEDNNYDIVNIETISLTSDSSIATDIPWVSGFSVCGNETTLYVFSGNMFPKYDGQKQNLGDFLPPKVNRNILPKNSSQLLKINLSSKTVDSVAAPEEAGGNCTSIKLLDSENCLLLIVSDPNIWIYSPEVNFIPEECQLSQDYGGCKVNLESSVEGYICLVPKCALYIHLKCDYTIKGKTDVNKLMCPTCRDMDPVTGKKRPKVVGLQRRGRPRKN